MKASSDINELKQQLTELNELHNQINTSKLLLSINHDAWVALYCTRKDDPEKPIEPKKKQVIKPSPVDENNSYSKKMLLYLVVSVVSYALNAILNKISVSQKGGFFSNLLGIAGYFITSAAGLISLFAFILSIKRKIDRDREIKSNKDKFEQEMRVYNENIRYNDTEYPRLLEQYRKDLEKYEEIVNENNTDYNRQVEEFDKKFYNEDIPNAEKTLKEGNEKLLEYEGLISNDYIPHLEKLIKILDNGRAESLKEALNVLESDLHNERILDEAKEKNRMLQHQIEEEERRAEEREREEEYYRREMLNEAKRQSEAAERQEREYKERAEQERRETARNERAFNKAQREYNDAIYRKQNSMSSSNKDYYERKAAEAYSDMLKYKK